MGIESFMKGNASIIMWALHIGLVAYVLGKGTVLSYEVHEAWAVGAIAGSMYIFINLLKDLKMAKVTQEEVKPPTREDAIGKEPFKMEVEK